MLKPETIIDAIEDSTLRMGIIGFVAVYLRLVVILKEINIKSIEVLFLIVRRLLKLSEYGVYL